MKANQHVIIELKTGVKCEGLLESINKEKMIIFLSNAKRTVISEDKKINEEFFSQLEISKEEIKEVKIVQFDEVETPKETPINTNINAIPQNIQHNAQNNLSKPKTYDKTDSFFDQLTPMNNQDAQFESMRYNDKNAETFDLPKNSNSGHNYNYDNNYKNRRGGNRGRGFSRGGNQNYNNYQNNNYTNQGFRGNDRGEYQGHNKAENEGSNFRRGNDGRGFNNGFNNQNRRNYNNDNYNQFPKQNQIYEHMPMSNQSFEQGIFQMNENRGFGNGKKRNLYDTSNFCGNTPNQNYGNQGGRGQNRRNFNNNLRNREGNFNNRVPNPDFNSINENNDNNENLDEGYTKSIYDKPSSSDNSKFQNLKNQPLTAYTPELLDSNVSDNNGGKSIYDK